jgi:hypothetical protein
MSAPTPSGLYGLLAEFHAPEEIVKAAAGVYAAGYRKVDAYTPYPMEDVLDALHLHRTHVPMLALTGGVLGLVGGFALQYWSSVNAYPLNIGGRPLFSWPAFIVPAFETTVLGAAVATVLGMLLLNGFPQPYHPVFNVKSFATASRDRFFLCVESRDPKFDLQGSRELLMRLGAHEVSEVQP